MHELVNLATFLMAPGAEYVNGQTISIDGAAYNASGGNFSALSAWDDQQWAEAAKVVISELAVEGIGTAIHHTHDVAQVLLV